jgi:hypothetical protein
LAPSTSETSDKEVELPPLPLDLPPAPPDLIPGVTHDIDGEQWPDGVMPLVPIDPEMPRVIPNTLLPTPAGQDPVLPVLVPMAVPVDFKLPKKGLTIGQVFAQLEKYTTPAEKVAWLRHNDRGVLRYLLRLGLEPSVEWVLPKGLPPYKPLQLRRGKRVLDILPGAAPTELFLEARRLYLFVKGGADSMDRLKREKVFQQMLEDMHPVEVDVLLCIKDKQLDKFVTPDVVTTAFPDLLTSPFQLRFIRR